MRRIKGIGVLRAQLKVFLDEVLYSIAGELVRIARTVRISELAYNPFGSEVSDYVDAISLPESSTIVIETSFSDLDEKKLADFVADGEIGYDQLIDLLELLKGLEGGHGKFASLLRKIDDESISFDREEDDWICKCGNIPASDGFYTCDADGNYIEAGTCSDWDSLYRCDRCGRVIDQRDRRVVGINLNPTREEDF